MARLIIQSADEENAVIALKLGVNRIGRNAENDFQIEHPTISSRHCELHWVNETVKVKDCNSTNGVFINEERIKEAAVEAGQFLRLGNVVLYVESTSAEISVPHFNHLPAPPIPFADGSLPCQHHPEMVAAFRCTHCGGLYCPSCIHRLKVKGSSSGLRLCPDCSGRVELVDQAPEKKKGVLAFLSQTLRIPFKKQRRKKSARK